MKEPMLILAPGREKSLRRRHVWIFSGAIAALEGNPAPGETVVVVDSERRFLARAAWSPESQLAARVWSFDPDEPIDAAFFRRRVRNAVEFRRFLRLDAPSGGCRLIHSEGDALPGLIADRYGEFIVVQFLSTGTERFRSEIVDALRSETGARGIYERSDAGVRAKEGLPERCGVVAGEAPPNPIVIEENGAKFAVDVRHGQKSGFYFDQRDARAFVARLAAGKRMLNAFSYTGGFGVAAALAGAEHVINIDSSAPALKLAAHNMERNRIRPDRYENRESDVFAELRSLSAEGRKFDLIVLDPPKFIDSRSALTRGCRAYQDIARLGFGLLAPGGVLCNFSCSGLMTPELFQKITADAAVEANVRGVILHRFEQAADHPAALAIPESFYLKGLATRIDA